MSTATVTPFAATAVTKASERGTQENAPRERRAQRDARAKQTFSNGGLTYLGHLAKAARQALADGKAIAFLGSIISQKEPTIARCVLCGGVHSLDNPELSGKITFYQVDKTKDVIALSDSCRLRYEPLFATKLSNSPVYLADFPKPEKR